MSKSKRYRKKHGIYTKVNPKECWSLDNTLCRFIIPRLERYKKDCNGTPLKRPADKELSYLSPDEWDEIIDTMIWSFSEVLTEKVFNSGELLGANGMYDRTKFQEYNDKVQLGLNNFALYFRDLWW